MAIFTFRADHGHEALKHIERLHGHYFPVKVLWDERVASNLWPIKIPDEDLARVRGELERNGLWRIVSPIDVAVAAAEVRILQSVGFLLWDFQPERVFSKRGRKIPGCTHVGPGTRFANPFKVGVHGDSREVVVMHRRWLDGDAELATRIGRAPPSLAEIVRHLVTRDLSCSCQVGEVCHADTLLLRANSLAAYEKRYRFIDGPTRVYKVLHDRERYPMSYWYCLDPRDIGRGCAKSHFDVRSLPEQFFKGVCKDRDHHADAIIAALEAGHDFVSWEQACQAKEEAEQEALRQARLQQLAAMPPTQIDSDWTDEIPF